jgi:uncharacterized protein
MSPHEITAERELVSRPASTPPSTDDAGGGDEDEASPEPCDVPECLDCGACCFSTLETYIRVSGDDHARMGELAERYTRFIENRCYMLIADGRCAALTVERETSRFPCAIYEHRPSICRDLARCSPPCFFEHATKTARAAAALHEPEGARAPKARNK